MKNLKKRISATLESYLENIKTLQHKYGAVRVTDLADKMGCKLPSVTSALRRLVKIGLINYETYRPVTLTSEGEAAVRELNLRHKILADFLKNILLLPPEQAEEEACGLEHKISLQVLKRLEQFMAFIHASESIEKDIKAITDKFNKYLESIEK